MRSIRLIFKVLGSRSFSVISARREEVIKFNQ